jgi:hypothetical protein
LRKRHEKSDNIMHIKESENRFYATIAGQTNNQGRYDCLVLFSGGKDSTYIAHTVKQKTGARVCLFAVDNGFEHRTFTDNVRAQAWNLGCDLYIFQAQEEQFTRFYNFLITEPSLKEIDTNPLCFFCGRYIMASGVEFAEKMNIPLVFYGATPDQIHQAAKPKSLREIEIFQMVSRRAFMGYYHKIRKLSRYREDPVVKKAVDTVFYVPKAVRLMFPFQYIPYHPEKIKQTLERDLGWKNPTTGLSNNNYLTSGCKMVQLFGILAKNAGFVPHESEQFKKEYERGIISKAAYEYNQSQLQNIMNAKITPEIKKLAKRLNLDQMLKYTD